jgi:phosphoribosylglycinamide formyltransferase 1
LPKEVIVFTDGGSRGNPGPAAAGFLLKSPDGAPLQAKAFYLGKATNNQAEYTALVKALTAAKELGVERVKVFSDSELLVRQLNGQYKVKSDQIRELYEQASALLAQFWGSSIEYIPREKNKKADELVNKALDLKRDVELSLKVSSRKEPLRLGVLISGGGTTLMNILQEIKAGRLNAKVTVVISSRSDVTGVEKAQKAGMNVKIICRKDFTDINTFSHAIEKELVDAGTELVIQGGWLCLWKIPQQFENRVMNIHPALLPSFGGKGMWGHHVHEAVLNAGCKVSGCTVHFCTNQYDSGPIIIQRCCMVKEGDSADTLAARVFEQECMAYPEAIRLFAEGRLAVENGHVKIKCE